MAKKERLVLRPGIINPNHWYPERPPSAEWNRIRKIVMEKADWTCVFCKHRAMKWMNLHHLEESGDNSPANLAPCCVACHSVLHIGRALMHGVIEIWNSKLPQIEIVQHTRKGVRAGKTLAQIKKALPLTRGPLPPASVEYANGLIERMGQATRADLDEPLCAIFVNLNRWQLEDSQ